jgi:hypothetical protein
MNIGADHNSGYGAQELFGSTVPRAVDRLAFEGKGEITKYNQDYTAWDETGVICSFTTALGMITPEVYGKLLSSCTGVKDFADPDYLWKQSVVTLALDIEAAKRDWPSLRPSLLHYFTEDDECIDHTGKAVRDLRQVSSREALRPIPRRPELASLPGLGI